MINDKINHRENCFFVDSRRLECLRMDEKCDEKIVKNEFSAVILSAGFSSRMHDFKPLLPIGEIPAIGRLVQGFAGAGVGEIIVVVGHRHKEIEAYLKTLPKEVQRVLKIKLNPIFAEGMYTSVQAGVAEVSTDNQGFFMLPVDYPLVRKEIFGRLMDFWCREKQSATRLVYPVCGEKRGHPPLLSTEFIPEILTKEQPMGLRSFFMNHQHHAENLAVDDETILWDMDSPADYAKLCEMFLTMQK